MIVLFQMFINWININTKNYKFINWINWINIFINIYSALSYFKLYWYIFNKSIYHFNNKHNFLSFLLKNIKTKLYQMIWKIQNLNNTVYQKFAKYLVNLSIQKRDISPFKYLSIFFYKSYLFNKYILFF